MSMHKKMYSAHEASDQSVMARESVTAFLRWLSLSKWPPQCAKVSMASMSISLDYFKSD